MTAPETTNSTSIFTDAYRKHKAPATLCLVCFQKWDENMGRHLISCKIAKGLYPDCDARKNLGVSNAKVFRRACAITGPSLFFSMTELKKKETYSPFEVAELLRSFGHCAVPEEFEHVYVRRPVYNDLTNRNFKTDLEEDSKRRQEEAEKRASGERLLRERQTPATISEPEKESVETEKEKQRKKANQDNIDPPVLRRRGHLGGQKRKTVYLDEDEESGQQEPSSKNEEADGRDVHFSEVMARETESELQAFSSRKGKAPLPGKNTAKKIQTLQESETAETAGGEASSTTSGGAERAPRIKVKMTAPETTNSTSIFTDAYRKHKAPATLCLVCFQKWDENMGRHLISCKIAKGLYPDCDARKNLGVSNAKLFRRACAITGPSLFFSLTELKKKETYSPFEVAELLRSFGHCAVPEEYEHIYVRRPVYNDLTKRNFKREAEEDSKRRQEEAEKGHFEARALRERQASVTIPEPEDGSVIREEERQLEKTDRDELNTPVVRTRDHLRRQKRKAVHLDEGGESSQQGPSCGNGEENDVRPNLTDTLEIETGSGLIEVRSRKGKAPLHGKNKAKKSKTMQESETTEAAGGSHDGAASGSSERVLHIKEAGTATDTEEEDCVIIDADNTKDYMDIVQEGDDEEADADLEKQYNFTKGTKAELMKIGWYKIPKQWLQCQVFKDFWDWYAKQGKEDRTKENSVRNIIKLLFKMSKGTMKEYSYEIITEENFQEACDTLVNVGVNYQTIYNYFKSLRHFVQFEKQRYQNLKTAEGDAKVRNLKLEMCDIEEIGTTLQAKARDQRDKDKQIQDRPPTPWEVTAVMRSEAKGLVDRHLESAENGHTLNRDQTALVNRYLVCQVLLKLGHRPATIERLTVNDVELALKHNRKEHDGRTMVCISSKDNEAKDGHTAWIVLDGQILDFYERYANFLRPEIVSRTQTSSSAYFLQYNGRPFTKISQAASRLQQQFQCEVITNDMARKSYMFYLQRCSEEVQNDMADFLGMSR